MKMRVVLLRFVNQHVLGQLEYAFWRDREIPTDSGRPVFVLGAPRCGSTVLTQAAAVGLNADYLTNMQCRFAGFPAMAGMFSDGSMRANRGDLVSRYGRTVGRHGLSECGAWWYRFFPVEGDTTRTFNDQRHRFVASMASLISASDRPYIFKNLYNCNRIGEIVTSVPSPVFVVVSRDIRSNAVSILNGRMDANGNYDEWWSVPVDGKAALTKRPPEEQVVEQIRRVYGRIESSLDDAVQSGRLAENSIVRIKYEDFCSDVRGSISRMRRAVFGVNGAKETVNALPASLVQRQSKLKDAQLHERLIDYLKNGTKPNGRGGRICGTTVESTSSPFANSSLREGE